MNTSRLARYVLGICAAAGVLAGCSGGGSAPSALGISETPQSSPSNSQHPQPSARLLALTNRAGIVPVPHASDIKAWMSRAAKSESLLYTSDQTHSTVNVYDFKGAKEALVGQLTGFLVPYGECVDRSNNVYIVDLFLSEIFEYAHGGTSPIATAFDNYGFPIGCSVDPTTGNVAVSNYYGFTGTGTGGVLVFAGGLGGSQTNYTDSEIFYIWPPGYDSKGNLYVEGSSLPGAGGVTGIAELPAGSSAFTNLTLSGASIYFPGSVQWDGKYVEWTDQGYNTYTTGLYRTKISGTTATVEKTSVLTDTCYLNYDYNDVVQPFLYGAKGHIGRVVGGNIDCTARIDFWDYQKGGNPLRSLSSSVAAGTSWGQAISRP